MHDLTQAECGTHKHCCFSWGAIFAGAFTAIGLSFLLNLFGATIGLSFVKSATDGSATLAIGGFIGLLIGVIASMYAAGCVAGHLARRATGCESDGMGILYGFLTWCLALILAILLTIPIGRYLLAYSSVVTNATSVITIDQRVTTVERTKVDKPATNTKADRSNKADRANAAKDKDADTDTTTTTVATNRLGIASFLIFVLFFVGAISCCLGGHCGMCSKCEKG